MRLLERDQSKDGYFPSLPAVIPAKSEMLKVNNTILIMYINIHISIHIYAYMNIYKHIIHMYVCNHSLVLRVKMTLEETRSLEEEMKLKKETTFEEMTPLAKGTLPEETVKLQQ